MTSEEIIKEMASLPAEAKREIEDLVTRLRKRYGSAKTSKSDTATGLETEEFIGMWIDRGEMTDSSAWVRGVRDKHWAN